jgi:hypothetical protein
LETAYRAIHSTNPLTPKGTGALGTPNFSLHRLENKTAPSSKQGAAGAAKRQENTNNIHMGFSDSKRIS